MTRFERWMLLGSLALAGVSGGIYAWMKYLMATDDPYAVVNHPLQPLMLKVHIVTAPLLVFAIGLVFMQHVYRQWRSGRPAGRTSGLVTGLVAFPMILSGYLIQTVTSEALLKWLVVVHLVTGAAYLVGFTVHRFGMQAREARRRRAARARMRSIDAGADKRDQECA
jgi:hypothetical protein